MNVHVFHRQEPAEEYVAVPEGCHPSIVCIDGQWRTECLQLALTLPRPLRIVFDNWMQDFIYLDETARELMVPYEAVCEHHVQADHKEHEGRPWQTAIWSLT